MSEAWDSDDFARLLALEHAFNTIALISAGNFAFLSNSTVESAVAQFRSATESAILDQRGIPKPTAIAIRKHLGRMFDLVTDMAKQSDLGQRN